MFQYPWPPHKVTKLFFIWLILLEILYRHLNFWSKSNVSYYCMLNLLLHRLILIFFLDAIIHNNGGTITLWEWRRDFLSQCYSPVSYWCYRAKWPVIYAKHNWNGKNKKERERAVCKRNKILQQNVRRRSKRENPFTFSKFEKSKVHNHIIVWYSTILAFCLIWVNATCSI